MCFNLNLLNPVAGPCGLFACRPVTDIDFWRHDDKLRIWVSETCHSGVCVRACLSQCGRINVNSNSKTTRSRNSLLTNTHRGLENSVFWFDITHSLHSQKQVCYESNLLESGTSIRVSGVRIWEKFRLDLIDSRLHLFIFLQKKKTSWSCLNPQTFLLSGFMRTTSSTTL